MFGGSDNEPFLGSTLQNFSTFRVAVANITYMSCKLLSSNRLKTNHFHWRDFPTYAIASSTWLKPITFTPLDFVYVLVFQIMNPSRFGKSVNQLQSFFPLSLSFPKRAIFLWYRYILVTMNWTKTHTNFGAMKSWERPLWGSFIEFTSVTW